MKTIPSADTIKDPELRQLMSAVKELIEILAGQRGNINDRALIVQDLINIGVIRLHNGKIIYNPNAPEPVPFTSDVITRTVTLGGISGTMEAVDPTTTPPTTKTWTITGGSITAKA